MLSLSSLESPAPPPPSSSQEASSSHDRDLQPEVENSLKLPDTHNTVAVRATLAQEYVKVSRDQVQERLYPKKYSFFKLGLFLQVRTCESLIHDQHLQHQGWAAALANLEDSVTALEKRRNKFDETYQVRGGHDIVMLCCHERCP